MFFASLIVFPLFMCLKACVLVMGCLMSCNAWPCLIEVVCVCVELGCVVVVVLLVRCVVVGCQLVDNRLRLGRWLWLVCGYFSLL